MQSSRSSSVPKFGAWDERDPKSGEGFTVIFNKVKEEKQITAAKFPPVQVQPDTSKNREKNEPRRKVHYSSSWFPVQKIFINSF